MGFRLTSARESFEIQFFEFRTDYVRTVTLVGVLSVIILMIFFCFVKNGRFHDFGDRGVHEFIPPFFLPLLGDPFCSSLKYMMVERY